MVLIGRKEIFSELKNDRELASLIRVLFEPTSQIEKPQRVSQTADAVVSVFSALQSGDVSGFRESGLMLKRRKIAVDSDWIYDDLLAFAYVVGNLRFGGDADFVDELLRVRLLGGDERSRLMSESLNALSKSHEDAPLAAILVVGKLLAQPDIDLNGEALSKAFEQSLAFEAQPTTQQFLRLIGEKTVEVATALSARTNSSDYSKLMQFRQAFDFRAKFFAQAVVWLLLLASGALWVRVAMLYFSTDKASEEFAGKLFQMGVIVGPFVLFFARRQIRGAAYRLFYKAFGGSMLLRSS
jgi:hypothetical protein